MLLMLFVIFVWSSQIHAEESFDFSERLKMSIQDKDVGFISSLDRDNKLVTKANLAYLFDSKWIMKFDSKKRSVRDILMSENLITMIRRIKYKEKNVFVIYWVVPTSDNTVDISHDKWLKNYAACAVTRETDRKWRFFSNLCYAETEGP